MPTANGAAASSPASPPTHHRNPWPMTTHPLMRYEIWDAKTNEQLGTGEGSRAEAIAAARTLWEAAGGIRTVMVGPLRAEHRKGARWSWAQFSPR